MLFQLTAKSAEIKFYNLKMLRKPHVIVEKLKLQIAKQYFNFLVFCERERTDRLILESCSCCVSFILINSIKLFEILKNIKYFLTL